MNDIIKVSYINHVLKKALNETVTLDYNESNNNYIKAEIFFKYLLDTYTLVSHREIEKTRYWHEFWTIRTISGHYLTLSKYVDYPKNQAVKKRYTISKDLDNKEIF